MSHPPEKTHTAFRYMSRFRCIGSECESSCCSGGWNVTIDREHYDKTRSAMSSNPVTRQEFDAKLKRVKTVARTDRNFALTVLQDNGDCSFLDEERLCSLQRRYGAGVLSDTCTVYPRTISVSGERLELAGTVSCPEVGRQLLLHADAMELDAVSSEHFSRSLRRNALPDHPTQPYVRYHDELRNLMMDMLSDDSFPLSSRLCFIAYFANRVGVFLDRHSKSLDEDRLLAEVELSQAPELRLELHHQFSSLAIEPAFGSRVVLAMAQARSPTSGFRELLDGVLKEYLGVPPDAPPVSVEGAEGAQRLIASYQRHKQAWAGYSEQIDRYFTNYAKNFWVTEWYAGSPSLLTHTVLLLARIATLRFLLYGHPLLAANVDRSDADRAHALSLAVVQTVQKFSRAFEHDRTFTASLKEKLADAKMITLAHATCLATF